MLALRGEGSCHRRAQEQEHSVEQTDNGWHPQRPHLPHRLTCTNSEGETVSIIALVKTQGSDTKLVAQMQPWDEAQRLEP